MESKNRGSKSKHCGRTSEGARRQSKGQGQQGGEQTRRCRRDQVSQIYAEMVNGKTVVLDVRLNDTAYEINRKM